MEFSVMVPVKNKKNENFVLKKFTVPAENENQAKEKAGHKALESYSYVEAGTVKDWFVKQVRT